MTDPTRKWGTTSSIVRARKTHHCEGAWAHDRMIRPGELYHRLVCFPEHDANGGKVPWVVKLCAACRPIAAPDPEVPHD